VNHSHKDNTWVIPLGRKTQVTEAVGDELKTPKADGFTRGEFNTGQGVVIGNADLPFPSSSFSSSWVLSSLASSGESPSVIILVVEHFCFLAIKAMTIFITVSTPTLITSCVSPGNNHAQQRIKRQAERIISLGFLSYFLSKQTALWAFQIAQQTVVGPIIYTLSPHEVIS
jgi:hypothetical protein